MDRDANDKTIHCDNYDSKQPESRHNWSPQPLITLTDMSDSTGVQAGRSHQQILYSEDFDAIQDYLQHTDSPMLTMSPSWLCRGPESSTVHVFPPTTVNHCIRPTSSLANTVPADVTGTSVTSRCSAIDMSSSIGLHGREVCAHVFVFFLFISCLLILLNFVIVPDMFCLILCSLFCD